jgi:hypothetical protein
LESEKNIPDELWIRIFALLLEERLLALLPAVLCPTMGAKISQKRKSCLIIFDIFLGNF